MSEEKRSPIEEALATLQSNPEIITKIADAIGMESSVKQEDATEEVGGTASEEARIPDGIMEKLPLILSALGGSGGLGKLNLSALMGDPKKTALWRSSL